MSPRAFRGVALRPIHRDDWEELRQVEFALFGSKWFSRGATPSSDLYPSMLGSETSVALLAFADDGSRLCGWFQIYRYEPDNQVAYAAIARVSNSLVEFGVGAMLFIEHVFASFSLQKIYFEVPAYNEVALAGMGRFGLVNEGRLLDRVYHDGEHHDVSIWALNRHAWSGLNVRNKLVGSFGETF